MSDNPITPQAQDKGASDKSDRAFVPSASSPQAVSPVPASIPSAGCAPADFTDEYREKVCRLGVGAECCRYLSVDAGGWGCLKRTSMRFAIDGRADSMNAKGDNCDGVYEPRQPYVLLRERFGHPAGTIIYEAKGYDYGLASDDSRAFGVPHTSMTLEPSGDYPTFTVPDDDFDRAEQVSA